MQWDLIVEAPTAPELDHIAHTTAAADAGAYRLLWRARCQGLCLPIDAGPRHHDKNIARYPRAARTWDIVGAPALSRAVAGDWVTLGRHGRPMTTHLVGRFRARSLGCAAASRSCRHRNGAEWDSSASSKHTRAGEHYAWGGRPAARGRDGGGYRYGQRPNPATLQRRRVLARQPDGELPACQRGSGSAALQGIRRGSSHDERPGGQIVNSRKPLKPECSDSPPSQVPGVGGLHPATAGR